MTMRARKKQNLQIYKAVLSGWYKNLGFLVRVFHLSIIVFETDKFSDGRLRDFYITQKTAAFLDLLCVVWYCLETYLLVRCRKERWGKKKTQFRMFMTSLGLVDSLIGVFTNSPYRLTRVLRVYYYSTGSVRITDVFAIAYHKLMSSARIMLMLFFFVLFCACVAFVMWLHKLPKVLYRLGQDPLGQGEGIITPYYDTFSNAIYNLLVCLSTANFPDIMLEPLDISQWYYFFFIMLYIMGMVFLQNLVLGNILDGIQDGFEEDVIRKLQRVDEGLKKAFQLLDIHDDQEPGNITRETWKKVMPEIRPDIDQTRAGQKFDEIDKDGNGTIDLDEFLNLLKQVGLSGGEEDNSVEDDEDDEQGGVRAEEMNFIRQKIMEHLLEKPIFVFGVKFYAFDFLMDILVFGQFILVMWATEISGQKENAGVQPDWAYPVDVFFIAWYCVEVVVKVYGYGPDIYFFEGKHLFDFIVTFLGLCALIWPEEFSSQVVILRLLRLTRLISRIPAVRRIGNTLFKLSPHYGPLFMSLTLIMYLFSVIGMIAFSGLLTREKVCGANWNDHMSLLAKCEDHTNLWVNEKLGDGCRITFPGKNPDAYPNGYPVRLTTPRRPDGSWYGPIIGKFKNFKPTNFTLGAKMHHIWNAGHYRHKDHPTSPDNVIGDTATSCGLGTLNNATKICSFSVGSSQNERLSKWTDAGKLKMRYKYGDHEDEDMMLWSGIIVTKYDMIYDTGILDPLCKYGKRVCTTPPNFEPYDPKKNPNGWKFLKPHLTNLKDGKAEKRKYMDELRKGCTCEVHGGPTYIYNSNRILRLFCESAYILSGYEFYMNFNDFFGAMRVCTMLVIVNNWHLMVDACTIATGTQFTRAYFILFYFLTVVYFFNIIVSFTLAAFGGVDDGEEDVDTAISIVQDKTRLGHLIKYSHVKFDA